MSILDVVPEGNVLQKLGEAHALQDANALLDRIKSDLHQGQLDFVSDQNQSTMRQDPCASDC